MNPQILIDAIVRQTTVLIARLSTLEGVRSPLGHIAGEVFLGIVKELESQGLGKKVIADMFGLALRSYRQKVQRSGESATTRGVTLWTAVHAYLAERESASRAELLQRFKNDEETSVRGILNDLVESGLVLLSGRGDETRYRVATEEELRDLGAATQLRSRDADAALVWLQIYQTTPVRKDQLAQSVPLPPTAIDAAIETLVKDGRVRVENRADGDYCVTDECLIPVGEAAGWEAAVVDHHRAVLNALASKIAGGTRSSAKNDEHGGTTLTFELWPGHPLEAEVRRLLATTRSNVIPLWEQVAEHNRQNNAPDGYQVHFYCGQYVVQEEEHE
jgi:predicted transcriptional regulator